VPGTTELTFREGTRADLGDTFALADRAMHSTAVRQGVIPPDREIAEADIRGDWLRHRPLFEFLAAQGDGRYLIAENGDGPVGFARVVRFGAMEQLTELMVEPEYQGQGLGRDLLQQVWPGDPTPELGRLVVAAGSPQDLSLYTDFGTMPVAGHWHMRQRTELYLDHRSKQDDHHGAVAHVLTPERALAAWNELEPAVVGHDRRALHEFLSRDRTCLATMRGEEITGLCWVSGDAEIGPALGVAPGDLVPVVLAALDRVAKTQEPNHLSVFCTTLAWWLLRRLRTLGFSIYWPSWVMCSVPLPGLDSYAPTRPPHVL
jgi:GNAT superfamily N-acetyltransferase